MNQKKNIEKRIVALHEEGWHVPNIAYIAKVGADVVKQILREKNLLQ